jgi:hypothetical protein
MLCALALFLIVACSAANSNGDQANSSSGQPQGPVTVADIARDPARFAGETVTLEGVYQGFNVSACRFPDGARTNGLTRSDWLLRSGEDCLYVTGGAPPGIDPIDPSAVGRTVRLSAIVRQGDGGSLFLQFRDGALIER